MSIDQNENALRIILIYLFPPSKLTHFLEGSDFLDSGRRSSYYSSFVQCLHWGNSAPRQLMPFLV